MRSKIPAPKKYLSWISESEIDRLRFEDKAYFRELAEAFSQFKIVAPCPLIMRFQHDTEKFLFIVGSEDIVIHPNNEIAPEDQVTLLEQQFLRSLYPRYRISRTETRRPTQDEIAKRIKDQKIPFEEAYKKDVVEEISELGIIDRVFLREDIFRIKIFCAGKPAIYRRHLPRIPLSEFLKELRQIPRSNNEEIYDYISKKSTVTQSDFQPRQQTVSYKGKLLENFFKINSLDVEEPTPGTADSEGNLLWGHYIIVDGKNSLLNL